MMLCLDPSILNDDIVIIPISSSSGKNVSQSDTIPLDMKLTFENFDNTHIVDKINYEKEWCDFNENKQVNL